MESRVYVIWNTEISIDKIYHKYRKCKPCNIERSTKRYYDNKDKFSKQQKINFEKNREKLLQKQNDCRNKRNTDYKELNRSYVELQNKIKSIRRKNQNK